LALEEIGPGISMSYLAIIITTALALIGWAKPGAPPDWMTATVVLLLVILCFLQVWVTYRRNRENAQLKAKVDDLHQATNEKPIFDILLNGEQVKEKGSYSVGNTNGELAVEFTLQNNGSATAEDVQVHLLLPRVFESCHLGRHWRSQGALQSMTNGKPKTTDIIEDFAFIGPAPIHPGNWMRLGQGKIKLHAKANGTIAAKIKVHSRRNAFTERSFFIHAD